MSAPRFSYLCVFRLGGAPLLCFSAWDAATGFLYLWFSHFRVCSFSCFSVLVHKHSWKNAFRFEAGYMKMRVQQNMQKYSRNLEEMQDYGYTFYVKTTS